MTGHWFADMFYVPWDIVQAYIGFITHQCPSMPKCL